MHHEEHTEQAKQSLFNYLGPRKTFFLGIVATLLVGMSLGFVVLLVGDMSSDASATSDSNSNTSAFAGTTNTNPAPTEAPTNTGDAQIRVSEVTSDDHIRGDLNTAEVVVVEYSDTECPFCKRFHPTMQQVVDEYGDRVAWVYRHFPLDTLHAKARGEAEATECAAELGGEETFWAYLDKIYEITPSNDGLQDSQLTDIATELGLDADEFRACRDSGRWADKVQEHYTSATQAGGNGTPYSIAISSSGEMVPISGAQPYASVKAAIDSLLTN